METQKSRDVLPTDMLSDAYRGTPLIRTPPPPYGHHGSLGIGLL